jgi:hypothetical protein
MPNRPQIVKTFPDMWATVIAESGQSNEQLLALFLEEGIIVEIEARPPGLYVLCCLDHKIGASVAVPCHYCKKTVYPHDAPPPNARACCASCLDLAYIDPELNIGNSEEDKAEIEALGKLFGEVSLPSRKH